jgi:hypothetical protein
MDCGLGSQLAALTPARGGYQTSLDTSAQPGLAMMFWHERINEYRLLALVAE